MRMLSTTLNDFEAQSRQTMEWIAEYLRDNRAYPVLARVTPGEITAALPIDAPEDGEPFEAIFGDFERIIMPGITHWNHPRFFGYFAISAAPVAVLAEALSATLDVNAMLWRTSPSATELEEVVLRWLRQLIGLPPTFSGIVYDTASIGGFTALAGAREALDLDIRERGMTARDLPPLRVYITEHTHSHIEKAALTLGVGRENVVQIPVDNAFCMNAAALRSQIAADEAAGMRPMCIVATVGTTSTTSADPLIDVAHVAREKHCWLHVDAAYAGVAAMLPEFRHLFEGIEHADSIVVNPHKWLFVPIDFSALYVRKPEILHRAFSLVADYLATPEHVRNYMDYGLQLGRRFRALKLWFVLRHLGARTIRETLRRHIALAQEFAQWVDAEPNWKVMAPHPFSVVCFRHAPAGAGAEEIDAHNLRIMNAVNEMGKAFISSTQLDQRVALRLAIGNYRTTRDDVLVAWRLLREAAS
ncbi:MAG: amino acid decarboxylase [Candidatus Eremiobacteraeota bacterium]|nr:amino acid decarboxylase [Candidatus Eremiobacteraeota bacterium]